MFIGVRSYPWQRMRNHKQLRWMAVEVRLPDPFISSAGYACKREQPL